MNTIVMNTLNGAVTEYDDFATSVAGTFATNTNGLYRVEGLTDNTQPVVGKIRTGTVLWSDMRRKQIDCVFVGVEADSSSMELTVLTRARTFRYRFGVRPNGVSKVTVGRGIWDNYLGFEVTDPAGRHFSIDRIEVKAGTSDRRRG